MRKLPVIGFAAIAMVMAICCVAIAAENSDDIRPTAVDAGQLADFMANEVLDLQDLAEGADVQRRMFDRMTPPGLIWTQPMYPPVVPFDAANYEKSFWDSLQSEEQNSVAVYSLSLVLDPKTHETFVYNSEGNQIMTIPAGKSMPGWPADADPARVTLQLSLLPVKDVEQYLYTEERIAEIAVAAAAKSTKYPRKGSPAMKSLGASEFGICNIQHLTNGSFRLTVTNGEENAEIYSYTVLHTAAVAVITWTNEQSNVVTDTNTVWTPVTPPFNGIESAWVVVTTNLALTNGVGVGEDTNVSSNDRVRFYAVANRIDTDEDGLSDGAEILLHRTDPNLADTDSDSIPDGAEIYLGLNPLNAADAGEDPDYDELTCREEWELGTDINISNVVQIMYFVDQIPPARMQSSTNAALYYTWTNMQAKAVYSGRLKTGNLEFSSTNLPSSDYPRYYLDRILTRDYINTYSSRTPTWVETYTYTNSWLVHNRYSLQGSNCILSLADSVYGANGFGSRDFYSEEFIQCRGIRIDHHDYGYYQPQPSNTLLVNEVDVYNSDCSSWTNEHLVAINTALSFTLDQSNTISHTLQQSIFQDQGGYSMGEGCTNSWEEIDVRSIILTNEYSDTVLRAHTDDDMQCLNNWAGLEWGQYIYHPYQYLTPQIYTLLPSNIRSYYYLDGNHTWNGLQALRYRWNISTGSGVVHRLIWWEQYIPDNSNQMTTISQKIINLLGTGGVNSTTNIDLPPPSVQGSIYPVPMNDVLKVETAFADPDDANWADLAEEKVIFSDKDTRIKIKVTPQLGDLQTIFYAIGTTVKIRSSETAPNGQDFTMTSQNTTLVQGSGYSELRVALTRSQLISLGVLPSQESDSVTEKAWYDTGFDTTVSAPNLLDGQAFNNGMSAEIRGQCTQAIYGGLDSTPPNSPLDNSFFKAGGVEIITAECCSGVSDKRQLMNQADYFYYSGHGFIATGAVYPGGPSDVIDYWDKDLDVVIFAGCSVLDINDYNNNTNGAAHLASPGEQWEPTGPALFLGYNWKAPTDLQNSDGIISSWLSNRGSLGNIGAWEEANDNMNGHNACAIEAGSTYYYFEKTEILGVSFWDWTSVPKSSW